MQIKNEANNLTISSGAYDFYWRTGISAGLDQHQTGRIRASIYGKPSNAFGIDPS